MYEGYVGVTAMDNMSVAKTGDLAGISAGATDASLTPYHVTRSKLFVRERFGKASLTHIDTREIEANIEHTRFPVPEHEQHTNTADYPGLLRAADLIGQLADINYFRKTSALFVEFQETGAIEKLGYQSADDLRVAYPAFFWQAVRPYIGDALRYLRVTQEGKQWISNLYAHVFSEEHRGEFRRTEAGFQSSASQLTLMLEHLASTTGKNSWIDRPSSFDPGLLTSKADGYN